MAKPKVFVSRLIPEQGLQKVLEATDADVWDDELPPPYDVLVERVKNVDGLLSLLTDKVDENLIHSAKNLKVISQYAVGFDNIDVKAATARGIPVGHTPGVLTDTTADLAFTLLMATARRISEAIDYVRAGRWKTWGPMLLLGQDVSHATLGLVGFGRIGQAMAQRASGFHMKVLYYDVYRREDLEQSMGVQFVDFDTLLAEADFISIHTTYNPTTHHLFNDAAFAKMKRTAILINTARGAIVDPDALYRALRKGQILAAGLDVTEPEPIPMTSPLLTLPNCLIVPHIASASVKTRGKMAEMAADNLLAGLRGEKIPYCANPEVYNK